MIKDYRSIIGANVLAFDTGEILATVRGIIIHPDTGMVEAFWIKPRASGQKFAILLTGNVLELKKNVYVKDDRVFTQSNEVIRIREILQENRPFLGQRVENETGHSYGRCFNVSFDVATYALKNITARKTFLGFTLEDRIFSYDVILHVTERAILVQDVDLKKETTIAPPPAETATG